MAIAASTRTAPRSERDLGENMSVRSVAFGANFNELIRTAGQLGQTTQASGQPLTTTSATWR